MKQVVLEHEFNDERFLVIRYSYRYSHIHGIEDLMVEHALLVDKDEQPLNVLEHFTEDELLLMCQEALAQRDEVEDRVYDEWEDRIASGE